MTVEREFMEFDVVVVGGGPAGLSTAIKLMQLAQEKEQELTVCLVEKGSEIGAHILSGAVFETTALDELFPEWKEMGAPVNNPVNIDEVHLLTETSAKKIPNFFVPKSLHNHGNHAISLGNLCRWLGERAEELGIEIFPGFAAQSLYLNDDGSVGGIITGDMGIGHDGNEKDSFTPGYELRAKYTVFAEGCRGHLGKELTDRFNLNENTDPQHYGIGIKELWDIAPEKHHQGKVVHSAGWPLDDATGGGFLYHLEGNQVVVGLITDLNYKNAHLSPFDEFQRMKHHPLYKDVLEGGTRVSYGARAISKGGLFSLGKMHFPGGLIVGCDAGTLNGAKIKGSHTAMKSGMIAAEVLFEALSNGSEGKEDLCQFATAFKQSWLYKELYQARNFGGAIHKFGSLLGGAYNTLDQNFFCGNLPFTFRDTQPDYLAMKPASECTPINYPKPDGKISFDKPSSVFLSNTNHEEDQPSHLKLSDQNIPIQVNLVKFDEPAQRYCPAGVYEILKDESGEEKLQINAQNCVHCKTCDIKDPSQNITWVAPEGGGGPNYPNM